ncbi:Mitochondrial uncoupling protein 6 [Linum perenne]
MAQRRNYSSVVDAIVRMSRQEGVGSLRRGSSMTVNRAMLVTASQLTCVDEDFELHATISDLVSSEGNWNIVLIGRYIGDNLMEGIASMLPSRVDYEEDDWVWGIENNGQFRILLVSFSPALPSFVTPATTVTAAGFKPLPPPENNRPSSQKPMSTFVDSFDDSGVPDELDSPSHFGSNTIHDDAGSYVGYNSDHFDSFIWPNTTRSDRTPYLRISIVLLSFRCRKDLTSAVGVSTPLRHLPPLATIKTSRPPFSSCRLHKNPHQAVDPSPDYLLSASSPATIQKIPSRVCFPPLRFFSGRKSERQSMIGVLGTESTYVYGSSGISTLPRAR